MASEIEDDEDDFEDVPEDVSEDGEDLDLVDDMEVDDVDVASEEVEAVGDDVDVDLEEDPKEKAARTKQARRAIEDRLEARRLDEDLNYLDIDDD